MAIGVLGGHHIGNNKLYFCCIFLILFLFYSYFCIIIPILFLFLEPEIPIFLFFETHLELDALGTSNFAGMFLRGSSCATSWSDLCVTFDLDPVTFDLKILSGLYLRNH